MRKEHTFHESKQGKLLKSILFLAILAMVLYMVIRILTPKYYYFNRWPTTSTFTGFYQMEKNTVDVLFMGSSHSMSGFSPQRLYDQYGIRSYNLGSERQNLFLTYYWLKEALKSQRPRALVLDGFFCFPYFKNKQEEVLNSSEPYLRKSMDYMHWSANKWEAIREICRLSDDQDLISYLLPTVRFHSRWTDFDDEDFLFYEKEDHYEMKGYTAIPKIGGSRDYLPFQAYQTTRKEEMLPLMREYLDKIKDLCKEEGIRLILVNTPQMDLDNRAAVFNTLSEYADQNGLDFYDFNETTLYDLIDYDFFYDNMDTGHANIRGSVKLTDYIGKELKDRYEIPAVMDKQWEDTAAFYQDILTSAKLPGIKDVNEYLAAIRRDRFSVFITVKEDGAKNLSKETVAAMQELGLKVNLQGKEQYSYYAAVTDEGVYEELSQEELAWEGAIRDRVEKISMTSAGKLCGSTCSIKIGGKEYAKKKRGLNIVVYDEMRQRVVDSVVFDTSSKTQTAKR